jgi:hypothetical protein
MRDGSPEHSSKIAPSRLIDARYRKIPTNRDWIAGYSNLLSRNPF